jgi:hypothetical protein
MGVIWVKCPATGRHTSTGIEADVKILARFPDQFRSIRCPACGMHHIWQIGDAWLGEPEQELPPLKKAG